MALAVRHRSVVTIIARQLDRRKVQGTDVRGRRFEVYSPLAVSEAKNK